MNKFLLTSLCLAFILTGISCGTVKGIGEDLSAVGGWVTKSSDSVKEGR